MFGTIRKHQSWLWAIIITAIIISFVVMFSPDVKWGALGGRSSSAFGTIDGQPITQQQLIEAGREARLLYFLNFQKWPDNDERARQMGFDVQNEAYMRLLRLAKVRQENIRVSDETVALLAQRLLGPKTPLDAFVKEYLAPQGITEADFERFLRHDAAIQQLGAVAGLSGKMIPPREIETNYRDEHEELDLQAVFLSVSNYLSGVTINDAELMSWYTNNMALFRVPEKVRVEYVHFATSNFLAEAEKKLTTERTNLNALIEQDYLKQGPETFKDESGKQLSKEAAVKKIKDAVFERNAMVLAAIKANGFASKLYDEKDHTAAGFAKFAAAQGYPVKTTEPFDEVDGPAALKVAEGFGRTAFALTNKEEAVSFQPIEGESGLFVFALKEQIPSSNPPFETVRSNVVARYRFTEAQKLVRQAGMTLQAKITAALAQGKTFTEAATEAGFKPTALPPISRATRQLPELPPNVYLPQLKNVAFTLQPGKSSQYMPTLDGGFILFLRGMLPMDETKMKSNLAEYAANVRMQRMNEAFGLWFRKQADEARLPMNRPENERGPAPGRTSAPKSRAKT